jgi:hypothetical protein
MTARNLPWRLDTFPATPKGNLRGHTLAAITTRVNFNITEYKPVNAKAEYRFILER